MTIIQGLHAREVLDSRGNPTVEVECELESGVVARFMVPSGASTGAREALELRDGDKSRFLGKGVLNAVRNVNKTIAAKLIGMRADDQRAVDEMLLKLDGTENKSKLGANAILGVSMSVARAFAADHDHSFFAHLSDGKAKLLPAPLMNFINGGAHADNNLDFQEIMVVPHKAKTFAQAVRMGAEIFQSLKSVLHDKGLSTNVGDEGGFAPGVHSNEEAIDLALKGILRAGYRPGAEASIALDCAASEFYEKGKYHLLAEDAHLSAEKLVDRYEDLVRRFPIVSIEDGMAEDDWAGWAELTQRLGNKIQLVGDDLFVTNPTIFKEGIDKGIANSILLKVNQIGTLTETDEAQRLARDHGYSRIISHRSGETEDTTIAHLAVGWETGQIKTGSVSRSDRIAKYNELLRIEEELGTRARFAGLSTFATKAPKAKPRKVKAVAR
jgi:enolase